jgi:hypothetical protein
LPDQHGFSLICSASIGPMTLTHFESKVETRFSPYFSMDKQEQQAVSLKLA